MAAGRNGSYRDDDSEFGYLNDRVRNGNRDYQISASRDGGRVRQKDVKEREVSNGGRLSGFWVDREPGELSGSSEEGIDLVQGKNGENGNCSPFQSKKRKLSPIVWDKEQVSSNVSKGCIAATLPPPPPLPKSYRPSPNAIAAGAVRISPVQDASPHHSHPLVEPVVDIVSDVAESPVNVSSSPLRVEYNDDYAPIVNIRSSRWADDADSSADQGQISLSPFDVRMQKKEMKVQNKLISPEFGELKREGSDGARARSSDSDEVACVRSSSRDNYSVKELDNNVYMETDEEHNNGGTSLSHTYTDSEDERDSRNTPEPAAPQRNVNMLQGCRSVDEFERLNKIDEGTYGVVYRAKVKKTGEIVALKKVKMEKEREGFPLTSLREINILLSFDHPSIVDVKEVVVGSSLDSIFMVMEYMEHDLKALMETKKQPFSQSEVKCLMIQLLEGVKYLHDNWVLHRDLKTSNLLLNNRGELKICDFGLARLYGSPLKPYTHLVVTLWYRAPELLLGAKQYSTAIDMWSLGCIMAELLLKEPLFNGKTEFDQIDKIFKMLGTPNETIWPGFSKLPGVKVNFVKHQYNLLRRKFPATSFTGPVLSDAGFDLLNKFLTYDPEKRITADAALSHEWFREVPLPISKDFMPTFPAHHAQDRRTRRVLKSPDPLEEQRRKELQQREFGTGGLFG